MAKNTYQALDRSAMQNAAKTLLANIRFAEVDTPIKSIVVTSSVPNEGKSTVLVSLAEAIASSGKSVLLVECDMRKRSLHKLLGVRPTAGFYAVLTEQVPASQAIVATGTENLYFLSVEPSIPNPADIVASKRFAKLLKMLEEHYDYVLLDTPPVGAFVDAAILSSLADATVFVVRENFAKREEIAAAFDQLKKAGANVIGSVLNCCAEETNASSYYHYYSKQQQDARGAAPQGSGRRFK